jgi:hypothetical protein
MGHHEVLIRSIGSNMITRARYSALPTMIEYYSIFILKDVHLEGMDKELSLPA